MRSIDYGEVWESQNIPPNDTGNGSIRHALKWATWRRYKEGWEDDLNDREETHPVLRTYMNFKANFYIEQYLNLVNVLNYRRVMSQLPVPIDWQLKLVILGHRFNIKKLLVLPSAKFYDEQHFITE